MNPRLESDASTGIDLINANICIIDELNSYLENICYLCSDTELIFQNAHRDCNKVAHILTKFAFNEDIFEDL